MADSVNVQHKLQMLFETKLDDKSKQQVGKQIKGMLENAVISFDEAEAKRNLESVIRTLNKLFSKAEMERLNFLEICVGWCKCEFIFSKTNGVKFV